MKSLYDTKIIFHEEMLVPSRALGSVATMSDGKVKTIGASWLLYAINVDAGNKIYLGQIFDQAEMETTMTALREGFANRSLPQKVAKEIAAAWKLALPEPEAQTEA